MADLDIEQLKTLFENLGDRLERTKGDQLTRDELYRMRQILQRMSNQSTNAKGTELNSSDLIQEFFKEWKAKDPLKGLRERQGNDEPRGPRRTIIEEVKQQKKGGTEGLTFLDRELRGSGQEVDQFGNIIKKAGSDAKDFSGNLSKSTTAIGSAAALFGGMFGKATGMVFDRVDYYRDILASGEGSIDSIQDLGRQSVAAGVTMEQFAKAMKDGTDGARLLGGVRWLQLNKSVTEMTRAGGAMGMTVEQIQAASQDYSELLRLQGMSRDKSTEDMARGMIQLVRSSETTANILGKTREEALAMAKEQASNSNVQASLVAQGMNDNQMKALNGIAEKYAATYGEQGKTLINDIIQYGQPLNKSATELAATLPELQQAALNQVASVKANRSVDVEQSGFQTARDIKGVSGQMLGDKARLQQYANMGALSDSALAGNFTAITGGILAGNNLKTNPENNAGTKQNKGSEERSGNVGILQLNELNQQAKVTKEALENMLVNPLITMVGPTLRDTVNPALLDFAKKLQDMAGGLESKTDIMGPIALGIVGLAGAISLFSGAIGIATKALGAISTIRGGASALGSLFGRGAAGAAGAGGAGGAGAAGGLGALALPALGVAAGGIGMWAGGKLVQNRKDDESFWGTGKNDKGFVGSRSNGYLASAGGGTLAGAAIGSVVPVIGTGIGAAVGGLAGLGYAWWNDDSGNATKAPQGQRAPVRAPQANQGSRQQPANATANRAKASLTLDQMTMRIMEANNQSVGFLKQLKDNSDKQLEVMREEVAAIRGVGERLSRLMEEGNRNTKSIADHSA